MNRLKQKSYAFTGQKDAPEIGLMFYNARWYDPAIAHFTQADSLIPGAGSPQAWDRYAYVFNNPMKYTDPSGNRPECGPDGVFCDSNWQEFMYTCENCREMDIKAAKAAVNNVGKRLGAAMGLNSAEAFFTVYQHMTFQRVQSYTVGSGSNQIVLTSGAITVNPHNIVIMVLAGEGFGNYKYGLLRSTNNLIHELGHAFAGTKIGRNAYDDLEDAMKSNSLLERFPLVEGESYGFASGYHHYIYQISTDNLSHKPFEIFADMFVGFVTGRWYRGSTPPYSGSKPKDEVATINMAKAKETWINDFMNQALGK